MPVILTAAWVVLAACYESHLWPAIAGREAAAIAQLFSAYAGDLAFFWLVLGYIWLVAALFQQSAELRQQSEYVRLAGTRAEAATRLLEGEIQNLRERETARIRAAQPRWEVQGCIAHKEQHEITLRNTGAPAFNVKAVSNAHVPIAIVLSNPALVDRGQLLTVKIMFQQQRMDEFEVPLEYLDASGELKTVRISVSHADARIEPPSGELTTS